MATLNPTGEILFQGLTINEFSAGFNFELAISQGIDAAILRATAGANYADPRFPVAVQRAQEAGMRLGYAIGAPALINALTTTKNSFNHFPTDAFCQTAAIAACSDIEWYVENCRKVINTRDIFCKALSDSGWNVIPSKTNFVLVSKDGMPGKDVYESIKKQGILVRYFDIDVIRDFVRITIGTDEQMKKLLDVMKKL